MVNATQSQIIDQSDLKKYRTEIPNIIDDLDLSPAAMRLYFRLKRVAGANGGDCNETTRQLADHCRIGVAHVHRAKIELLAAELISIEKIKGKHGPTDKIIILDIWPRNFEHFSELKRSRLRSIRERSDDSVPNSVPLGNAQAENEPNSVPNSVPLGNVLKEQEITKIQEKNVNAGAHVRELLDNQPTADPPPLYDDPRKAVPPLPADLKALAQTSHPGYDIDWLHGKFCQLWISYRWYEKHLDWQAKFLTYCMDAIHQGEMRGQPPPKLKPKSTHPDTNVAKVRPYSEIKAIMNKQDETISKIGGRK